MKEQAGLCEFVCEHVYEFVSVRLHVCLAVHFFCVQLCECVCFIAIKLTGHGVNPCLKCLTQRQQTQISGSFALTWLKFAPCRPFTVTLGLFCRILLIITVQTHLKHHQNERLQSNVYF